MTVKVTGTLTVSRTTTILIFSLFFFLTPCGALMWSQMAILHCLLNLSECHSKLYFPAKRQPGNSNSGLYAIKGFKTPHIIFQRILSVKQTDSYSLIPGEKGAKFPGNLELLAAESQYSWCFFRHYLNLTIKNYETLWKEWKSEHFCLTALLSFVSNFIHSNQHRLTYNHLIKRVRFQKTLKESRQMIVIHLRDGICMKLLL